MSEQKNYQREIGQQQEGVENLWRLLYTIVA
jgi:hypothetical protein